MHILHRQIVQADTEMNPILTGQLPNSVDKQEMCLMLFTEVALVLLFKAGTYKNLNEHA